MSDNNDLRVSFSALEVYQQCPRKYFYNYIMKLPRKSWPWFVFGTYVHLVLEKFHKYVIYFKKRNREYNLGNLMSRAFMSSLRFQRRKELQGGPRLSDKQKEESKTVLANYLKKVIDNFPNVIYVEKGFEFHLDGITVRGYIDRIDKIDDNTYELVDYKTSSKSYEVSKNHQLNLYAYYFKDIVKGNNVKLLKQLNFLKLNQIKKEYYESEHENEMLKYIKTVSKNIKKDMESKEEKDWKCKTNTFCKLCDFKERCDQQRGIFL